VKRMLLAGAMVVTTAIALPVYAQMPTANPTPQAEPVPMSAPAQARSGDQEDRGPWTRDRGGWGRGGAPMMQREMWRRAMMRRDPRQRCIDRLAWHAARRAYVETELNLTPEQRPLWDKLQSIAQSAQQRERQLCNGLKPDTELTMLDRLDRAQQFLSARLDALQVAKPAVQTLYQSLTPEQREIFDHPFRRD
jgi:LTXXQ motif family protein